MTSDKKQAQQLRQRYIAFFKKNRGVNLCQLGRKSTEEEIMEVDAATMRLLNKKIWHKNACIYHKTNWEPYLNPVI